MIKLHEISENYLALQDIDDVDITDTLEAIEGEFEDKAKNVIFVITNQDGDIDAINAEIERLQKRKRAITNRKESLKDYLRENMEKTGINKINHPLFTINCVTGRDIAVIDDINLLPQDYIDVEVVITPKKKEITAALKDGDDIPGAHLEKSKSAIRIQ